MTEKKTNVHALVERLNNLGPGVAEAFAVTELNKLAEESVHSAQQFEARSEAERRLQTTVKQLEWQAVIDDWIKDITHAIEDDDYPLAHCLCDAIRTLRKVGRL